METEWKTVEAQLTAQLKRMDGEVAAARLNYKQGHAACTAALERLNDAMTLLETAVNSATYERSLVRNELQDLLLAQHHARAAV